MRARLSAALLLAVLLAPIPAAPAPARQPEAAGGVRIHALSLNVAGIPVVHPYVLRRFRAIAREVRAGGYDLAGLQEVWFGTDSSFLVREIGLPHFARYRSGFIVGAGLVTVSRYPILAKREHRYRARARRWAADGEFLANKGVLLTRVAAPGGELDVYNTHLVSDYDQGLYPGLRLMQVLELADFALANSYGRPALLLGDLNFEPQEPAAAVLKGVLGLRDPCRPAAKDLCPDTDASRRRVDYVLVPEGPGAGAARARTALTGTLRASVLEIHYSDHLGLELELSSLPPPLKPDPSSKAFRAALEVLEAELRRYPETGEAQRRAAELRGWRP